MINLEKFKHQSWLDGRIVAINGDCQEVMAEIGDKEVDLVLTDPPYGINQDKVQKNLSNKKGFTKNAGTYKKYHETNWDNEIPSKIIFDELIRISKKQIIWGGNYFHYLHLQGIIIWYKGNSGNFKEGELAKTNINTFKVYTMSRADAYINTLEPLDKIHPTQKPVALMAWCLNNYSKENDLIFDGFAGSGTTAIACIRTKRRFIGCELDKEYFEKACERIDTELKQLTLF